MKLALRYIPTEVWVDVFIFPWTSRKKLSRIVHMFRNRYFAEVLQYCLHELGKQTLGTLCLIKQRLPRAPLPENIKFFNHVDTQTLEILRQFNPLFTDVNLHFDDLKPKHVLKVRTLLAHLAPLIRGIHSMEFNQTFIPLIEECFGPKLAQVKRMQLHDAFKPFDSATVQTSIIFLLNWLTERDQTEPSILEMDSPSNPAILQQFAKQFQSSKCASTFAIHINGCYGRYPYYNIPIADFHLENNLGEQLHGEYKNYGMFQIVRHQPNGSKGLQEWIGKIIDDRDKPNVIEISSCPLTIGQIDAIAANEEDGKQGGDQPSTSNRP